MAKRKSTKKAGGRKGVTATAPKAAVSSTADVKSALKDLEQKRQQILSDGIAKREAELAAAQGRVEKAQGEVAQLEAILAELRSELSTGSVAPKALKTAGAPKGRRGPKPGAKKAAKKATGAKRGPKPGAKRGPKPGAKKATAKAAPKASGGGRGRKPRVSLDVKKQAVADVLAKNPNGILWKNLKSALNKSAKGVFSAADFNSATTFASKLLPAGYKIEGQRRAATIKKK